MSATSSMRDRILDAAEKRMRAVGYNAVSFGELAADVKIKSASIHYHFPQKMDLGTELVERYARRFKERLDKIDTSDLKTAITSYLSLYSDALRIGKTMCLCAILGAEANGLPPKVNERVGAFFDLNIAWLSELNKRHKLTQMAASPADIVSALEGAMIVSNSKKDRLVLESLIERIIDDYRPG
jgi:TetR/AcrR family transcriptional regulator, transcriptional repressor for nem operon